MKQNKKKKGELLVETIVAMTIAALMTLSIFSVFKTFSSIGKRQDEYIHFETVCLDIDKYYDSFGKEMWDEEYFGRDMYEVYIRDTGRSEYVEEYMNNYDPLVYLLDPNDDESLAYLLDPNDDIGYTYKLTYNYDGDDLLLSVRNVKTHRDVMKELNYGKSGASDVGEYYEQVQANNPLVYEIEEEEED